MIYNTQNKAGIGLHVPIKRGDYSYFAQTFDEKDRVRANIYNLLLTTKGERVMHPNFGTTLRNMVFDNVTENLRERIITEINEAISTWLTYVTVKKIDVTSPEKEPHKLRVYAEFTYAANPTDTIVINIDLLR